MSIQTVLKRPLILITGAVGQLGGLVLAEITRTVSENADVVATWHEHAPSNLNPSSERWIRFDLAKPYLLKSSLAPYRRIAVFHFACSLTNDFSKCFRLDCRGTARLVETLKSRPGPHETKFVFASSIAAREPTNYGLAKRWVETYLAEQATSRFHCQSIRIPVVQHPRNPDFRIPAARFARTFLTSCGFCRAAEDGLDPFSGWALSNKIVTLR